ncbi:MAG: TadE/TadG family type IV pilus assembly protein [Rickettsiales bacterium]
MLANLRTFLADCRAIALIEFAIVFPFLFVLLFGAIELGREGLIAQRVEKAGFVLSDITSQYPPATGARNSDEISEAALVSDVLAQLQTMMGGYYSDDKQRIILTGLRREGGVVRIKWQKEGGGTLSDGVVSSVNGLGPGAINASVKDTLASFAGDTEAQDFVARMAPGEMVVVGEVFYRYEPILTALLQGVTQATGERNTFFLSPRTIVKRMFFRPRNGDLVCLPGTFVYDECQVAPTVGGSCSCIYSSSQRVTDCASRSATIADYFRCPDGTTRREGPRFTAASLAACGSATYGQAIEAVNSTSLAGQCRNQ